MERWAEYKDGKLTPPVIIQCDKYNKEYLVWIWTGERIIGPVSRQEIDEKAIIDSIMAMEATAINAGDAKTEVDSLKEEMVILKAENVQLKTENTTLAKAIEALTKG